MPCFKSDFNSTPFCSWASNINTEGSCPVSLFKNLIKRIAQVVGLAFDALSLPFRAIGSCFSSFCLKGKTTDLSKTKEVVVEKKGPAPLEEKSEPLKAGEPSLSESLADTLRKEFQEGLLQATKSIADAPRSDVEALRLQIAALQAELDKKGEPSVPASSKVEADVEFLMGRGQTNEIQLGKLEHAAKLTMLTTRELFNVIHATYSVGNQESGDEIQRKVDQAFDNMDYLFKELLKVNFTPSSSSENELLPEEPEDEIESSSPKIENKGEIISKSPAPVSLPTIEEGPHDLQLPPAVSEEIEKKGLPLVNDDSSLSENQVAPVSPSVSEKIEAPISDESLALPPLVEKKEPVDPNFKAKEASASPAPNLINLEEEELIEEEDDSVNADSKSAASSSSNAQPTSPSLSAEKKEEISDDVPPLSPILNLKESKAEPAEEESDKKPEGINEKTSEHSDSEDSKNLSSGVKKEAVLQTPPASPLLSPSSAKLGEELKEIPVNYSPSPQKTAPASRPAASTPSVRELFGQLPFQKQ